MNKTILKTPGQMTDYTLFPLKYDWAWDHYKTMMANFWRPEEISMAPDVSDWRTSKLTEEEQHLYLTVFAQLTTFDLLRTSDIVQEFLPLVQAPEIIQVLTTQAFQECLHTESYQFIIESLGLPENDIYTRYKTVPALANRVQLTEKVGSLSQESTPSDIFRALVHTYILFESVWFRVNLLGPIQCLARRNLMKGTAEQFQLICRDEDTHCALGVFLIRDFIKEYPEVMEPLVVNQVIEDMEEGLRLEDEFIDYALPRSIMGYNALDHKSTVRFYAQHYLSRIGIHHEFGGEHKMPWMDEMIATRKEKNFFETRVVDYQIGTLSFGDDEEDEDWGVKF